MDTKTFDNLARLFASTRSRRQVLRGMVAGGALATAALTQRIEPAGAQCLDDDEECSVGTECCSGACSASLGVCVTMDNTCIEDGGLCEAGRYCCSGANCDNTGHCPDSGAGCVADNNTCSSDDDCCSGACDDSGYCFTPENTCIEDGGLCQAGLYCCSGADCAPGGHCPTSEVAVLPATGAGTGGQGEGLGLIAPVAVLGAAAVVGARRLRSTAQDETSS